jgi:hypothetical protein
MRLELCSQSKYRDGVRLGDDVPLIVPGVAFGVFDGATDPRGTMIDGIGAGRLAAETVARATARLADDPVHRDLPATDIVDRLSAELAARTAPLGLPIPPSTTLAVAFDCGVDWRFVVLGDSGIRLNGIEVFRHEKLIDRVSTLARVAVFRDRQLLNADPDRTEAEARAAILLGFDLAVGDGVLTRDRADAIIREVTDRTGLSDHADLVGGFLRGGIQTQFRFGNATGNPLCFDTMSGTRPLLGETIDVRRPKTAIRSIEIFSDGYVDAPGSVSVAEWEDAFNAAEFEDYHKIGHHAGVKGSSRDEVFDDRTILLLRDLVAP